MLNWAVAASAVRQLHRLRGLIVSCHYRVGIDQHVTALYFFFDPSMIIIVHRQVDCMPVRAGRLCCSKLGTEGVTGMGVALVGGGVQTAVRGAPCDLPSGCGSVWLWVWLP